MSIAVRKKRTTTGPVPATISRHDTLTVTLNVDILGSELLADRQATVAEAVATAKRLMRRQLDVIEVRS